MANKAPAFQFYAKDWFDKRVERMDLDAQGAYIRILAYMWKDSDDQCSIEYDEKMLAKLLGVTTVKTRKILQQILWPNDPIFLIKDGFLVSERLKDERKKQDKYRRDQAKKGKKSAEQRRNRGLTTVQPEGNREATFLSSSSSSTSIINNYKEDIDKIINWYRSFTSVPHPLNQETGAQDRERLAQLITKHGCDRLTTTGVEILTKRRKNNTQDPTTINYLLKCWENLDDSNKPADTQQLKKELNELILNRNGLELMVEDFPEYQLRLDEVNNQIASVEAVLNGTA